MSQDTINANCFYLVILALRNIAQLKIAVCDDSVKALSLMNSKSSLEYVIVIDQITGEAKEKAAELNIKILSFDEVKTIGKQNPKSPVVSEDI